MINGKDPRGIAETLLAVTLSALSAVEAHDWETAGSLLRRREQLLTQLEACPDISSALAQLQMVRQAEKKLYQKMEELTQSAFQEILRTRNARQAGAHYETQPAIPPYLEEYG
jgi:hypothetical protein